MYANSISTINIMFNSIINISLVNNKQKKCSVFCKYKNVFISIKTTTPHEGNLRAERIENFVIQFFCMPCLRLLVLGACLHHSEETCTSWTLFPEIINQIMYLKGTLAISKACQFITVQRNINFQFVPFQSIATQLFLHTIFPVSQGYLVHDTNVQIFFFNPEFVENLYQAFHL